ncbi:hypothetical protein RRG08_024107 [Elysia crispata]|uniref:Uncharacterized protein n=1 Tax=Elysia crispata TaxID=231223 RepID=A0AAE1BBQ7_9GAST|nr:hypothetical protein RRG08_024107 [Elysia crispata]
MLWILNDDATSVTNFSNIGTKKIFLSVKIKEILQHPQRDGQMVKSLTASLVSREEEERHMRNLNEDEQLKKQIAEIEDCVKESEHKLQDSGASLEQLDPGPLIHLKKLIPTVIAVEAIPTGQTVVLDSDAQCVLLE